MPEEAKEAKANVVLFPADLQGVNARLHAAFNYLVEWQKCNFGESDSGITSAIMSKVLSLLRTILEEPTETEVASRVEDLAAIYLPALQEALAVCPMRILLSPQDIKDLWPEVEALEQTGRGEEQEKADLLGKLVKCEEKLRLADRSVRELEYQLADVQRENGGRIQSLVQKAKDLEAKLADSAARLKAANAAIGEDRLATLDRLADITEKFENSAGALIRRIATSDTKYAAALQILQELAMRTSGVAQDSENLAALAQDIRSEYASLCDAAPQKTVQQEPPAALLPAVRDVGGEILRHEEYLHKIIEAMQDADEQRQQIEATMEEIEQVRKFSDTDATDDSDLERQKLDFSKQPLTAYIKQLIDVESRVRFSLQKLQHYSKAQKLVTEGIQESFFGQHLPELPVLPEVTTGDAGHEIENAGQENQTEFPRYDRLSALAACHGFSAKQAFITTLFEIVPDSSKLPGRRTQRSPLTILYSALRAGLVAIYGWKNVNEVLTKWRGDSDNESGPITMYLRRAGKVGRTTLYRRTEQALPWKPSDLFTQDEIARFLAEYANPPKKE